MFYSTPLKNSFICLHSFIAMEFVHWFFFTHLSLCGWLSCSKINWIFLLRWNYMNHISTYTYILKDYEVLIFSRISIFPNCLKIVINTKNFAFLEKRNGSMPRPLLFQNFWRKVGEGAGERPEFAYKIFTKIHSGKNGCGKLGVISLWWCKCVIKSWKFSYEAFWIGTNEYLVTVSCIIE